MVYDFHFLLNVFLRAALGVCATAALLAIGVHFFDFFVGGCGCFSGLLGLPDELEGALRSILLGLDGLSHHFVCLFSQLSRFGLGFLCLHFVGSLLLLCLFRVYRGVLVPWLTGTFASAVGRIVRVVGFLRLFLELLVRLDVVFSSNDSY